MALSRETANCVGCNRFVRCRLIGEVPRVLRAALKPGDSIVDAAARFYETEAGQCSKYAPFRGLNGKGSVGKIPPPV